MYTVAQVISRTSKGVTSSGVEFEHAPIVKVWPLVTFDSLAAATNTARNYSEAWKGEFIVLAQAITVSIPDEILSDEKVAYAA
jgi:hemoglobin-like flavoprotein